MPECKSALTYEQTTPILVIKNGGNQPLIEKIKLASLRRAKSVRSYAKIDELVEHSQKINNSMLRRNPSANRRNGLQIKEIDEMAMSAASVYRKLKI